MMNASRALRLLRTSLFLALAAASVRAAPLAAQDSLATVEGITEYRLRNGLRVLLFPDSSQPRTTVNITYLVGSRFESYGETGMAHFLEHLMFRGTPDHPDIPQELTEHGARPNGTTWYDRTNYFETFPSSEENLQWALGLEADRMLHTSLTQKDFDAEMTVVRNELEMGENSPGGILQDRVMSAAYLWQNYGKATIGATSDLENVPLQRVRAFYHKYYQPDNAVLVVAGRFDPAHALQLVEDSFGSIPRPDRTGDMKIWPTYTVEPTQEGERDVTLRRVGDQKILMVMYHIPPGSQKDFAPVEVLTRILGDVPSGRLHQALVETGLAARAYASVWQLKQAGPLFATAVLKPEGDLAAADSALDRTLGEVAGDRPVTEEEVDRARTELLNETNALFNDTERIALALSDWSAMGDWRLFFLHRDRIEAVTVDDVNRVARAYLKTSNRTVGRFIPTDHPDRAVIPPEPNVDSLVAGYHGETVASTGEAFDPSPANIDARTSVFTLDDGFQVALLPKSTRGHTVRGQLRLSLGDSTSLLGKATVGELTGDMLMRGTEELDRQQLTDSLDKLDADVSVGGAAYIATGSLRTTGDNLPAVLRLLGDVVRRPRFDPDEFRTLLQSDEAGIESQRSEPSARARIALSRHMDSLPPNDPRYTPTVDEQLSRLHSTTLDDVRAFHRSFYGPQKGNLVLIGDFDTTAVRKAVQDAFGGWKSPHAYHRIASTAEDVPPADIVIRIPDKANAFFMAQQNLKLRDDDPDYPALVLAGYMIGGGVMNSRLMKKIRQQEGLSYSVAAYVSGHPIDEDGSFFTYAISAPQNTEKVVQGFREVMQGVLTDGFRPDELKAAKEGYLQSRKLSRTDDRSLASTLSGHLYFGRTMAWDADFEKRIRSVTLDQVNDAVRRRLDLDRMSMVRAGTFGASGAADGGSDAGTGDSSGGGGAPGR